MGYSFYLILNGVNINATTNMNQILGHQWYISYNYRTNRVTTDLLHITKTRNSDEMNIMCVYDNVICCHSLLSTVLSIESF